MPRRGVRPPLSLGVRRGWASPSARDHAVRGAPGPAIMGLPLAAPPAMTRACPLVLALSALLFAGCVVGDQTLPPPGEQVDAGGVGAGRDAGGTMDGGGNGNVCKALVTPPDGHHRPGESCLASGCHAAGGSGPRFYLAGTAYTAKAGTAARPGATIVVPTGGGSPLKLHVAGNGNFWSETSMTINTKPKASGCPNQVQMPTATTNGNCNSAGCHDAGRRIALPL